MTIALFRTTAVCLLLAVTGWAGWAAQADFVPEVFDDAEIKAILQDRVDRAKTSVGIVVGLIDRQGARVISYGKARADGPQALDGNSVFEIGSITKIFTDALLLAMFVRGEVQVTDPIAKFLPAGVKAPTWKGRPITLLHLASHTSGLPRIPDNLSWKDVQNPYGDYSADRLYAFLGHYRLTRDIGAQYEYSDLGVGLLGHILTLRAGQDYESLVRDRICGPLGMDETRIAVTPRMADHLAQGHDPRGLAVKNWNYLCLAGAGALRSTANDLLKFLAANLELSPASVLTPILGTLQQPVHSHGYDLPCVGWQMVMAGGSPLYCQGGITGGYQSFLGFDRERHRGIVLLANSGLGNSSEMIGLHLLMGDEYIIEKPKTPEAQADLQ